MKTILEVLHLTANSLVCVLQRLLARREALIELLLRG
jgi:hypothetical protein